MAGVRTGRTLTLKAGAKLAVAGQRSRMPTIRAVVRPAPPTSASSIFGTDSGSGGNDVAPAPKSPGKKKRGCKKLHCSNQVFSVSTTKFPKCNKCGTQGSDAFCANCGNAMSEVAIVVESDDLTVLLEDVKLKVCVECTEEGYDAFCASCGGKMVTIDDDDDDDLSDLLKVSASDLEDANAGLARLEQALLVEQEVEERMANTLSSTPTMVEKPAKPLGQQQKHDNQQQHQQQQHQQQQQQHEKQQQQQQHQHQHQQQQQQQQRPLDRDKPSSASTPFLNVQPKRKVFLVDFGSDTVKYGWTSDENASCVRACVDTRAAGEMYFLQFLLLIITI
jgi:hypothetical protein